MKKMRIPTKFIEIDKGYRTKYLQHSRSGKMMGRTGRDTKFGSLPKLVIARTDSSPAASRVRRVKAKTGMYGRHSGEIFGRTSIIQRHRRTSKKGRKHKVKTYRRKR